MKAMSHYRDAIDTAEKNGFLQDQALSNELACLYFGSNRLHDTKVDSQGDCHSMLFRVGSCSQGRAVANSDARDKVEW